MKKQSGITLVSLIITIIMLLVLATVSINILMNGGIIDKAKTAVDKYTDEEVGEQIKLSYLEYQTERLYNTNLDLKEFMEESLGEIYGEVIITPYSETEIFPMLITIGQREFLLKKDGIPSAKKGITEYDVAKHPETYYGHYVTNYNSPNDAGINAQDEQKWQIFMADDTNIYLIASNYITRQYTGTKNGVGFDYDSENETEATATKMWFTSIKDQYNANSNTTDIPRILGRLDKQNIYHKWMNMSENQTKNYANEKAVASILDVDIWSGYKNSTYAKYAIGGPTIEMFCKAYNDTRQDGTLKLKAIETNPNGYTIKQGEYNPVNNIAGLKTGAKTSTINLDNFYFKSSTEGSNYWLSSPSASGSYCLLFVTSSGSVDVSTYSYVNVGFRPLVCLNSNVHLVLNEDGQTYSLELD